MSFLFKGQSTTTKAEKITSFQATTCDFGTPLPIAYGTCKLSPNLINYQDFTTKEIRTTVKTGKKSSSTNIDYKYYVYVELALCEGPIDSIGGIWVGDKTYDSLAALTEKDEGGTLSANLGNNGNPTTYMQENHPDKAVGYKNMAYLYGKVYLGLNSASMPSYNVMVSGNLRNTGDGKDANPADIIIDLIDKAGLSQYIDADSFENYRRYCRNADLLMSTPPDAFSSQVKTQDVIKQILTLTNAYMVQSVDKIKVIPRDDRQVGDWQPNKTITYDLTEDDFIKQANGACILFSKKDSTEINNRIGVTFVNRDNDYEEETIFYDNTADIAETGLRAASTVNGKWFYKKSRAIKCAEMLARINATETTKYTFKLDWAFERLEPGDLVTLTDSAIGISKQVAMVETVTTDVYGRITVTAIGREAGNYSAAAYNVHSVDYNYVDYNITPTDTDTPLLFTPPSELMTSNGLEVWCAMRGKDNTWGGCSVYLSDKDSNYTFDGQQIINSSYGKTVNDLTANGTSVIVRFGNYNTVELLSGSAYDAEKGNTLIWLDGECMSYTKATLVAPNTYELSGLVRGQYQTAQAAHVGNSNFVVLDSGLYVISLTKNYLGRTLYMKLPSFNVFKGNEQDLATLDNTYAYVVNLYDIPNVANLTAVASGFSVTETINAYQINVSWDAPEWADYQNAMVYFKNSTHPQWTYADSGYNSAIITQAQAGETYTIAVCTRDVNGNYELPDASAKTSCTVALTADIPNAPTNFSIKFASEITVSWDVVSNAIISRYEVRSSVNTDVTNNILYSGTGNKAQIQLNSRTGTLYLYAVSTAGKYSTATVLNYNKPAPAAPTLTCTAGIKQIQIRSADIPNDCIAIRYTLDGAKTDYQYTSNQTLVTYATEPDIYDITACFVDIFGNGTESAAKRVTVDAYIPASLIEAESITENNLDKATQEALAKARSAVQADTFDTYAEQVIDPLKADITTITKTLNGAAGTTQYAAIMQNSNSINTIVENLGKAPGESGYSAIAQLNKSIGLKVSNTDFNGNNIISKINLGDGTVAIDGLYVHISGSTVFDDDVEIDGGLLKANSIEADKLNVSSLSAICATIGTLRTKTSGARVEIKDNLIEVYDDTHDFPRVKLGVW